MNLLMELLRQKFSLIGIRLTIVLKILLRINRQFQRLRLILIGQHLQVPQKFLINHLLARRQPKTILQQYLVFLMTLLPLVLLILLLQIRQISLRRTLKGKLMRLLQQSSTQQTWMHLSAAQAQILCRIRQFRLRSRGW
jgi:hypothetical protein